MTYSQPIHGPKQPLEVVVLYILIGTITNLGHQDGFPMMSVLVCMVTHQIRPMVSHDIRL